MFTVPAEVFRAAHTVYAEVTASADVLIGAVGTFFKAIGTDHRALRAAAAAVTDFLHAVAAVIAVLTPAVGVAAFPADIAVSAEVVIAVVAVLAARLADQRALRTATAAVADGLHAVAADIAVVTPAVITHAAPAETAVGAKITCTVTALLSAAFADLGTFRAAVAAVANRLHALAAVITVVAPAVAFAAVLTNVAITAEVVVAVIAMLAAIRTDKGAFRTAVSAGTDIIGTVIAGFAVAAEKLFAADTVNAGVASTADILIGAVGAFLQTALADCGTLRTSVAAITD